MDTTTLKSEIRDDLKEFQDYDAAASSFLERQLFSAATWLYKQPFPWDFSLEQANISTTSGNMGPYTLPVDFDTLTLERRLSKYYAYDAHDVDAPIQDGSFGRRYEVYLKRSSGTVALYFVTDPGDGTRVLTYRKKLSTISDMSSWPEDEDVKHVLRLRTSYLCTNKTPDWAQDAANFKTQSEEALRDLKLSKRAGMVRQDGRDPQDVWGASLYQNYAGDVDWA